MLKFRIRRKSRRFSYPVLDRLKRHRSKYTNRFGVLCFCKYFPPLKRNFISFRKEEVDENIKDIKDKRGPPRTIFDVPWLFEAREFLRKKLIGKRINVIVDYVQEARESLPERSCCTVMVGST